MSSSSSLPCARIGKYRLLAHVATGGMGTVYKARDEYLNRTVALKVLSPELAANPILLERFRREARHASRLRHRNIVTLLECGESDGHHFLAMEFIRGVDLSEYIRRRGKVDPEEARRITVQACKALDHAFVQGVTHRDIKPSNFLLANEDGRCRVKLADFGLARMENEEDFRVTRAGTTVGTVDYMAPEQARDSSSADIRSDIYALGCTLYQMLAGNPPFPDGGIGERVYKHIAVDPPDVRLFTPEVPAALWTILRRMLAKHPDDRFQTPDDLLVALRSIPEATDSSWQEQDSRVESESDRPPSSEEVEVLTRVIRVQERPSPVPAPARPPTPASTPAQPTIPPNAPVPPAERQPHPAKRKVRKPQTTVPEMATAAEVISEAVAVSPEQRQAAAGQFERASQIRSEGESDYALQLLLSSCKLDPLTVVYRKSLREVGRALNQKKSGWLGSITTLPLRSKVKAARRSGDHRKVLEHGEELLTRLPDDASVHLDMAAAAEALGCAGLTVWLLEEARKRLPENVSVLKALAGVYERQQSYNAAIGLWEKVRELAPSDLEAAGKIKDLSASETIARGNYRR